MQEQNYFVYILTNKNNSVLYTGITNNIINRVFQHASQQNEQSFTAKYNVHKLVYYEVFSDVGSALFKEKQIKAGSRKNKINLIKSLNPQWNNLFDKLF